ncbi:MAG: PLP-dependent aminotransferase family protein [Oscillospiraceae bacterium]
MIEMPDRTGGISLYEQIYESIKKDILSGKMKHGEKLPSKRNISEKLGVSLITIENAYSQLIAEGYVKAVERSGYYVNYSGGMVILPPKPQITHIPESQAHTDTANDTLFPFSVWTKLMRSVILEKGTVLLKPVSPNGAEELRAAISDYLYRARGVYAPPEQIIIGAGTDYLYNLLIQLLGRERCFAVENPGYDKLTKIYNANHVKSVSIPLDEQGMSCKELIASSADIAHISPAHHYPTGIIMPISRRSELMRWAEKGSRYIIEDDYDSEFRWSGRPVPTMFGMDTLQKVIYINTFSLTIAPSVRISYMVLPEKLAARWRDKLGFYSCSVPVFEQYTLARFISEGYFERHINRMKKHYRSIRELALELAEKLGGTDIREENAGLHFLMKADEQIISNLESCGVEIRPLSDYYSDNFSADGLQVVSYYSADEHKLMNLKSKL